MRLKSAKKLKFTGIIAAALVLSQVAVPTVATATSIIEVGSGPTTKPGKVTEERARRFAEQAREEFNEVTSGMQPFADDDLADFRDEINNLEQLPLASNASANCGDKPFPKYPEAYTDNGYRLNKNCDTIFVLPPTIGRLFIDGQPLMTAASMKCGVIKNFLSSLNKDSETALAITEKKNELHSAYYSAVLDGNSNMSQQELADLKRKVDFMQAQISEITETVIGSLNLGDNSLKQIGLVSTLGLSMEWQSLVKQYERLNKPLGYKVVPIPILGTKLSYNAKQDDAVSSLRKLIGGDKLHPVDTLIIKGQKQVVDSNMPMGETTESNVGIMMNGTLSGLAVLTNSGVCPYYIDPNSRNSLKAGSIPITSVLAANLLYAYPVQSVASYSVEYDEKFVKKQIEGKINEVGKVTAESVVNDLLKSENSKFVKFKSSQDMYGNEAYSKEVMANDFVNTLLSKIGSIDQALTDLVPDDLSPHGKTYQVEHPGSCTTHRSKGLLGNVMSTLGFGMFDGIKAAVGGVVGGLVGGPIGALAGAAGGLVNGIFGGKSTSCSATTYTVKHRDHAMAKLKQVLRDQKRTGGALNVKARSYPAYGTLMFSANPEKAYVDSTVRDFKVYRSEFLKASLANKTEIDKLKAQLLSPVNIDDVEAKTKRIQALEEENIYIANVIQQIDDTINIYDEQQGES